MRTYTNVLFDRYELQVLLTASRHLDIAYPNVRSSMPKKPTERHPDHEARVLYHLVRDTGQGTHANVVRALRVVKRLEEVITPQCDLGYWLDVSEQETGIRPEKSDEPTSGYQQWRMLAEIRQDQLRDTRRALAVLHEAAALVTSAQHEDELAGADG